MPWGGLVMTDRYDGYLYPQGTGRWPSTVVFLAVTSRRTQEGKTGRVQRETLAHWSIKVLRRCRGAYQLTGDHAGQGRQGFWSALDELCHKRSSVWVICVNANRVWPLVGLWEEIENGRIRILETAVRDQEPSRTGVLPVRSAEGPATAVLSAGGVRRLQRRQAGYLITTSGTNICKCWRVHRPAAVKFLDTANWGWHPDVRGMSSRAVCALMKEWWDDIEYVTDVGHLGALRTTVAGTAYAAYLYGGRTHALYGHDHPRVLSLEESGYHGGRCEAFRIGKVAELVWHLDFRSMYASVCVDSILPVALRSFRDWGGACGRGLGMDHSDAMARVEIATNEPSYPYRHGDVTLWPTGRFITVLAGPELADAVAHARVLRWYEVASYRMAPALAQHQQHVYDLRCLCEDEQLAHGATFAKALLVSLCGRFGRRQRDWIPTPEVWSDIPYGFWTGASPDGVPCTYRSLGGVVHREGDMGWAVGAVPALAAWITSLARLRLLQAMRCAGWDHVYYVDTDSMFVDQRGYDALCAAGWIRDRELGFLYAKSGPLKLEVYGIKYYTADGVVTCAGYLGSTALHATADSGQARSWTAREALRAGVRPEALEIQQHYARVSSYTHGEVLADGRVRPWFMGGNSDAPQEGQG